MPADTQTEDPFDFPCSYTFRAYSAQMNEGLTLPLLRPKPTPEPELTAPLSPEDLKKAIRQVLAEKRFAKVVMRERLKLLQESKTAQKRKPEKIAGEAYEGKIRPPFKGFPIDS